MPGRVYNGGAYRFGYNKGSEKDDEISGAGNHFTTFYREGDVRVVTWWGTDPKEQEQPYQSPYTFMNNSPIRGNDEKGDLFGLDNVVGAVVAAGVDYGMQVAGNIAQDGFSAKAFTKVDGFSIAISAGAGFLTSGISSTAILAKGITKAAVTQVVKLEAKNLIVNTTASVAKQIREGTIKGKSIKEAVSEVSLKKAVTNGAIANVASNLPGIFGDSKLASQALRTASTKVETKITTKGVTNDAVRETIGNIVEKAKDALQPNYTPKPNYTPPLAPADHTAVVKPITTN